VRLGMERQIYMQGARIFALCFPSIWCSCTLHYKLAGRGVRFPKVSLEFSSDISHLRILTQKPNSIKNSFKTANVSSSHLYQITIKELMIMLPLHGQNTAVLQLT